MRTLSIEDIRAKALEHGVAVTVGGERINSAQQVVSIGRQRLRKPKPKVEEPVLVPSLPSAPPVIHVDMDKLTEDSTAALRAVTEVLKTQKPPVAPSRPTEWAFEFKRDEKGFIQSVTAKATKE